MSCCIKCYYLFCLLSEISLFRFFFLFFVFYFSSYDIVNKNGGEKIVRLDFYNCKLESIDKSNFSTVPHMLFNFAADENNDIYFSVE